MPLTVLVLNLLGASEEGEAAPDTPGRDVLVEAAGAEELVGGGSEGLV